MIDDDEDGVRDRNDGLFVAALALHAPVFLREIHAFGSGGGMCRLGVRSHRERLRVFPEKCLPADSLLPGQSPAHEAKRCSDPKRSISAPILALQPYDGCPRDRVEKGPS